MDPEVSQTVEQNANATAQSVIAAVSAATSDGPVVYFDGVCGLCNRWVDFLLRHDRQRVFRFAPLQGETARQQGIWQTGEPLNSVVLVDQTGTYRKTAAISRMFRRLGFFWRATGWLLWCVPRPLRDFGYDLIARNRYRWFGRKESCRLPTVEERPRFLP